MGSGLLTPLGSLRWQLVDFEFRSFPNRNLSFQFIHHPLTRTESFSAMPARHPHKKRRLARRNKSNSMVNDNELERKRLDGLLRNLPQLMFSHFPMRFVFDPVNFSPLLGATNNRPKIDCCTRSRIH